MFELSPHQEAVQSDLIKFILGQHERPLVIAYDGSAGVGKTATLQPLKDKLLKAFPKAQISERGPTNNAVAQMRARGLPNAQTWHTGDLLPLFPPSMNDVLRWVAMGVEPEPAVVAEFKKISGLTEITEARLARAREAAGRGLTSQVILRALGVDPSNSLLRGFTSRAKPPELPKDPEADEPFRICIGDECSMTGASILEKVLPSYDLLICIGDQRQLKPVKDKPFFHTIKNRFTLKEIHRQAKDSPIITASLLVYPESALTEKNVPSISLAKTGLSFAQKGADLDLLREDLATIIVYSNASRQRLNTHYRRLLKYPPDHPAKNEIIIFYDNQPARGIYRNARATVLEYCPVTCIGTVEMDDGNIQVLPLKNKDTDLGSDDFECTYYNFAIASTCHSMQGSQRNTIYIPVGEERAAAQYGSETYRSWAYTAITRAQENCFLLM